MAQASEGDANAPRHLILFTDSNRASFKEEIAVFKEAYKSYKGDLVNVLVDVSKPDITSRIMDAFEVTAFNIPTIRAFGT